MVEAEISIGEESYPMDGELAALFRTMSNPDALRILFLASRGIENSTYAMEELGLTQKRYYARLKGLVESGLIRKEDGVYRQTALGRIMHDHLLPTLEKTFKAKDRLELLMRVEGTEIENKVKNLIYDELGVSVFAGSSNVRMLEDYEALAIEVIDLYDSAEESVLLASTYIDVRVIEAFLRAVDRGVTNRAIMGKNSRSSKIQNLRTMLSVTFAKTVLSYASNTVEVKNTVRFADLPYTFCVVDGHHNIIEVSNTLNERFIVALLIDDRVIGEKLTEFHNTLWKAGEFHSAVEAINHLKSG